MKTYSAFNFRSHLIYFYLLIFLGLAAIPVMIIIQSDNFWLNEFSLIPLIMCLVFIIHIFTSKITVTESMIIKRTIFGMRSIKIEDINSFGVMRQEGELGVRKLEESEFNSTDWFFAKTIFLSKDQNYDPLKYRQKGTIKFQYQENLYLDILHKIADCKHSRYE